MDKPTRDESKQQLEGILGRKMTDAEYDQAERDGIMVPHRVPFANEEKRMKVLADIVCDMEQHNELYPDTVIITIQKNDRNTNFKAHFGESVRIQVNQFRTPEHLAEALTEPDPPLINSLRDARRDVPDELVIVMWDSDGMLLVTKKKRQRDAA